MSDDSCVECGCKLPGQALKMMDLQDDWDSYGSPAPNQWATYQAMRFAEEISAKPTADSDGGVEVEWRRGDLYFCVTFGNDRSIELHIGRVHLDEAGQLEGYDILEEAP